MRVIRTEYYFDESFSPLAFRIFENPAIGYAWFGHKDSNANTIPIFDIAQDLENIKDNHEKITDFLLSLMNDFRRYQEFQRTSFNHANARSFINDILQQEVVIEQSPPTLLSLGTLLTKAPAVAIGTYIGINAAESFGPLMFITVPGGILVVSSAIGISRALENGLNKAVNAAIKRHLSR